MTQDIKARVALIIEAIDDNELQYGRYDNAIKELLKELTAREEKLVAVLKFALGFSTEARGQGYTPNDLNVIGGELIEDIKATLKELGLGE